MSGPDELPNPLMKEFGSPTDPTSPLEKWYLPGTDPVNSMGKIESSGTDPLSQVALNPQPLPPGTFSSRDPGPANKPSSGGEHGVRNGIIAVLIIAVLLIGGTFTVESFRSGNQGVAPNQLAFLQPGVIFHQQQVHLSSSNGGGAIVRLQLAKISCDTSPMDGLVEHLIGGGVLISDDLAVQSSYPSGDTWDVIFGPTNTKRTETIVAVCLREAPSFFTPSHTLDYVASTQTTLQGYSSATPATFDAACPTGEHILGGGYESVPNGLSVDGTLPTSSNTADAWQVVYRFTTKSTGSGVHAPSSTLQVFAICSATLPTHLEQATLPWSSSGNGGGAGGLTAEGNRSCAQGALLTGGYNSLIPANITNALATQTNSPTHVPTVAPFNATVQTWYVQIAIAGLPHVNDGALWVVCWDQPTSATPTAPTGGQPTATGATQSTNTPVGQPTNTPKPRATATSTPKPRPTNTPVPACQVLLSGSGAMNANNFYLNVEVAAGIGHDSSVAQVQFSPASGLLTALNGAKFSDKGAGGSGVYNSLTCAQLKSASYGATSVPATNGEVFLVKVADGHLAKVLVTTLPGNPFPSFTWTTYKP